MNSFLNFEEKAKCISKSEPIKGTFGISEMFNQFEKFKKREVNNRLIFRGVKNASFKMYSHAQRSWIENKPTEIYSNYLKNLIEKTKIWNNGVIPDYLKTYEKNFENNNLAYFSIMQHYELPTPLIDFTYDPFVALYFACKDVVNCPLSNDNDINNFFSVYFIYPNWLNSEYKIPKIKSLNLDDLGNNVYLIDEEVDLKNNIRIIAQKGLFIVNTSEDQDLISCVRKNQIDDHIFGCRDIHKSFANTILNTLSDMNINEETLFPDFNKLKHLLTD